MKLESPKITINKSTSDIFDFLASAENFKSIMPENIKSFETTSEGFNFALNGMPEIKLKVIEKVVPNKIVLGSASDKFPFSLTGDLKEITKNSSSFQLKFEGNFNPMISMMVKNPLQNFINTLTKNMETLNF